MNEEKIVNMFTELKELMISNFKAIDHKLIKFEERLIKLEESLIKLKKEINELNEKFNKHEEEQRLNFVKLEDMLFDRTGALFDGYEVNQDSYKELEEKINSIYSILDKYAYRIEKLESKAN